jgi:hypothetical protein
VEWLLLILAGGGAASWGGIRLRGRAADRRDRAEDLARVVTLCEEDVTLLGEQLQRLDGDSSKMDEPTRADYQKALDGYESADRSVKKVSTPEEVGTVTEALNDARYALACVQARIAGEPVPEKRAPCFFNPQHGPSVEDVMFTVRAGGTKRVPACAQDAARVRAGEQPDTRKIELNGMTIDYFDPQAIGKWHGHRAAMNALIGSSGFTGINDGGGGV